MNDGPARALDALRETYGTERVTQEQRRRQVRAMFDRIAPRYDLMNDLMSFGMHRLWKRAVIGALPFGWIVEGPVVDLAGGTGDLALLIKARDPARRVIVADASAGMLDVARKRGEGALEFVHAEAESLPFADASVAAVTLAFGLRNMADPAAALAEVARVLKPGGVLALLEFSRVAPWFGPFYALHSRIVIPLLGAMVARDRGAYRYLVESIRIFPDAGAVSTELEAAGLKVESVRRFVFGIAALHIAAKPLNGGQERRDDRR